MNKLQKLTELANEFEVNKRKRDEEALDRQKTELENKIKDAITQAEKDLAGFEELARNGVRDYFVHREKVMFLGLKNGNSYTAMRDGVVSIQQIKSNFPVFGAVWDFYVKNGFNPKFQPDYSDDGDNYADIYLQW